MKIEKLLKKHESHADIEEMIERADAEPGVVLEQLKYAGYRVVARHLRPTERDSKKLAVLPMTTKKFVPEGYTVLPRGGATVVAITDPLGNKAEGTAVCSQKDNFVRRHGLFLALKSALSKICENPQAKAFLKQELS